MSMQRKHGGNWVDEMDSASGSMARDERERQEGGGPVAEPRTSGARRRNRKPKAAEPQASVRNAVDEGREWPSGVPFQAQPRPERTPVHVVAREGYERAVQASRDEAGFRSMAAPALPARSWTFLGKLRSLLLAAVFLASWRLVAQVLVADFGWTSWVASGLVGAWLAFNTMVVADAMLMGWAKASRAKRRRYRR